MKNSLRLDNDSSLEVIRPTQIGNFEAITSSLATTPEVSLFEPEELNGNSKINPYKLSSKQLA